MKPIVIVVAVGMGALIVGGTASLAGRTSQQEPRTLLAQPSTWVPFTAKLSVEYPDRAPVVGAFYRSSTGSTRLETGPSGDDVRVVSIKNLPSRTQYVLGPTGVWRSSSMTKGVFAPLPFHTGMKNLVLHPHRVSVGAGELYSLNSTTGYAAYQYATGNGGSLLLVPELNFFPVVQQRADGRREVYKDIIVGEPDEALFAPPAGATVVARVGREPSTAQKPPAP